MQILQPGCNIKKSQIQDPLCGCTEDLPIYRGTWPDKILIAHATGVKVTCRRRWAAFPPITDGSTCVARIAGVGLP
jgi:hypothetical protein